MLEINIVDIEDPLHEIVRSGGAFLMVPVDGDDPAIFICRRFADALTQDELRAVVAHEEGHYVADHLNAVGSGIHTNQEFEFAADDYAVEKMGSAKDLLSAIYKTAEFTMNVVLPETLGDDWDDEVRAVARELTDAVLNPRIDRLKARLHSESQT
ncbi:unnamed protein product [Sphagnum jensenii]|uniref:Peptidase M48 domain-containing protein n=1 Tax=Sphagnum jensenii TaxID=128206 RepID=A0ABP0VJW8_9BRYO